MICKNCDKHMEFIGNCLWACMECNREKHDPEQEFGGGRSTFTSQQKKALKKLNALAKKIGIFE